MAITNGYATLDEIKARLGIQDSAENGILEATVMAASRAIDDFCDRRFYAETATRYFRGEGDTLFIDDLLAVTTIKIDADGDRTYETTWAATDYDLEPSNRTPYNRIVIAPQGRYTWPAHRKAVQIVGSWGYSATAPATIAEACLIWAIRLFKRKDAPFGVAGTAETGMMRLPKIDPDVREILEPYRRLEIGAV